MVKEIQPLKVFVLLCLLIGLYAIILLSIPKDQDKNRPQHARWWISNITYIPKRIKGYVVQRGSYFIGNHVNKDDFHFSTGFNDVLSEKNALQFKPCTDSKLAAHDTLSTLKLLGKSKGWFNLGDTICVQATMYDSYGRPKSTGGDHLRGRISSPELRANAPGMVLDHNNGSYTVVFEALWSGKAFITLNIAYTREAITAMYRITSSKISTKLILTRYESEHGREEVICHPDYRLLVTRTKYKDVCNFTRLNSGMPWYCGKPLNPKLKCSDRTQMKHVLPTWPKSLSSCEKELLASRAHKNLRKQIEVLIQNPSHLKVEKPLNYVQPEMSCVKYNTSKLWFMKTTTGFFFNEEWKMKHCKGFNRAHFQNCLRNKKLHLIGDSTTRQWYEDAMKRYNCIQFTEQWRYAKWKKPSGCTVPSNNFTVALSSQCQPLYTGTFWTDPKFTFISIAKQINSIPSNEDAIVLIHIYSHMIPFHHKHFRDKIRAIRTSVENLINRNKKARVFIKMPHTYTSVHKDNGAINDFPVFIYLRIIREEFRGLHDKVIPLDNKDATISTTSGGMHPLPYIVSAMVDQMFSYICG